MRFGICVDIKKIKEVERLGYDYAEGRLNAIAAMSEEEFSSVLEEVSSSSIAVEAFSLLFPKDMKLIGPGAVSEEGLVDYLELAFSRMDAFGAKIVVFGSGKSRFVPEGMRWQDAYKALVSITRIIGKVAEKHGITVAIEPLNKGETNLINSLTEGAALQADVGMESIALLADLYHMWKEGEEISRISLVSPLAHAHIAVLEGRGYPTEPEEKVVSFITELEKAGYNGRISIEGSSNDWENDSLKSLKMLRSIGRSNG